MMSISDKNEIIAQIIYDNITGDPKIYTFEEFGFFKYTMFTVDTAQSSTVNMGMVFPNFKDVFDYSGKKFIENEYKDYKYDLKVVGSNNIVIDLVLKADQTKYAPLREKPSKKITEEEKAKLKVEREAMRNEREQFAKKTAEMFGTFRVKFYASVLDQMLRDVRDKVSVKKIKYELNAKNVLHIIPAGDRVELIFGINFMQDTDIALTKVFLQELEEAKRHVRNCIDAKCYMDKNGLPSDVLSIDTPSDYSNGLVVFNLYVKNYDILKTKLNYFVNFKQYIQFHIHSIKTFLHIRMNKKGKEINEKICACKIVPDEYLKGLETLNFYTERENKENNLKLFATEAKKVNV